MTASLPRATWIHVLRQRTNITITVVSESEPSFMFIYSGFLGKKFISAVSNINIVMSLLSRSRSMDAEGAADFSLPSCSTSAATLFRETFASK